MITSIQLQQMKSVNLALCNKDELIDIKTVNVDESFDKVKRLSKYIEDVKNPYLFKVGDTIVNVQYGIANVSLQESIVNILTT